MRHGLELSVPFQKGISAKKSLCIAHQLGSVWQVVKLFVDHYNKMPGSHLDHVQRLHPEFNAHRAEEECRKVISTFNGRLALENCHLLTTWKVDQSGWKSLAFFLIMISILDASAKGWWWSFRQRRKSSGILEVLRLATNKCKVPSARQISQSIKLCMWVVYFARAGDECYLLGKDSEGLVPQTTDPPSMCTYRTYPTHSAPCVRCIRYWGPNQSQSRLRPVHPDMTIRWFWTKCICFLRATKPRQFALRLRRRLAWLGFGRFSQNGPSFAFGGGQGGPLIG